MELIIMIITGAILVNWDKKNKQELQNFPIEDRKGRKKEIIKFLFIIIFHYCIVWYIFILLIELLKPILDIIGYDFEYSYGIRNQYARIASIIVTALRIPKLKKINLDDK